MGPPFFFWVRSSSFCWLEVLSTRRFLCSSLAVTESRERHSTAVVGHDCVTLNQEVYITSFYGVPRAMLAVISKHRTTNM